MIWISARKISRILAQRQMTASQLDAKLPSHRDTLYDILKAPGGSSRRQEKTAQRIADALGVDIDEILTDGPAPPAGSLKSLPPTPPLPAELEDHIIRFDWLIDDRTHDFVGRDFVFEALDAFLNDPGVQSGYFWIRGDPGIGKTAFLAQLVKSRDLPIHHFNVAPDGITTQTQFLGNLCVRLIKHFGLPHERLPDAFDRSSVFLVTLLGEAVDRLPGDLKLVIVVDAVDEGAPPDGPTDSNPLLLPSSPPDRVYFVVSSRFREDLNLQATNVTTFDFDPHSRRNKEDVRELIGRAAERPGVLRWAKKQRLNRAGFVEAVCEKSEGNFMYLHHVLPAIERGEFTEGGVDELPVGLRGYYRRHWNDMKKRHPDEFERICEPIICILAAVFAPVPVTQISEWTKIESGTVMRVLNDWNEFLHVARGRGGRKTYRVYHTSFQEFLKDEVDPDLTRYDTMIARAALKKVEEA